MQRQMKLCQTKKALAIQQRLFPHSFHRFRHGISWSVNWKINIITAVPVWSVFQNDKAELLKILRIGG